MNADVQELTRILWNYNRVPTRPAVDADLLIVMGTNDLGVPKYAARIISECRFKAIIATGGVHHDLSLHGEYFGGIEADVFKREMLQQGCNDETVILETAAKNTGDNITLSEEIASKLGYNIKSGLLLHTPTMQRRALATAEKQWPSVSWRVNCEDISFEDYIQNLNFEKFVNGVVGDSYRILRLRIH